MEGGGNMKQYQKPTVLVYNSPLEVNAQCYAGHYCSATAGPC